MRLRPKSRTLTSSLLRVLVPRAVLFGIGAAILGLGQMIAVSPSAHSSAVPAERAGASAPRWTAADRTAYPGCVPSSAWPTGTPAKYVVVHNFREDAHQLLAFDRAWQLNHDDTEADDVWVLGVCG